MRGTVAGEASAIADHMRSLTPASPEPSASHRFRLMATQLHAVQVCSDCETHSKHVPVRHMHKLMLATM